MQPEKLRRILGTYLKKLRIIDYFSHTLKIKNFRLFSFISLNIYLMRVLRL